MEPVLQKHNVHFIMAKLRGIRPHPEVHCVMGKACPVWPTIKQVITNCENILIMVNGLCLGCLRGGNGNGFDLRDHEGQCCNRI